MIKPLSSLLVVSVFAATVAAHASDPPGADVAWLKGIGATYVNQDYSLIVMVSGVQRETQHERLTPPPIYPGFDYTVYVYGPGWASCWGGKDGQAIDVDPAATRGTFVLDTNASDVWCIQGSTRHVVSLSCVANGNAKYDTISNTRTTTPTSIVSQNDQKTGNEADCVLTLDGQTLEARGLLSADKITWKNKTD